MGFPRLADLVTQVEFVALAALVVILLLVIVQLLLLLRRLRTRYRPIVGIEEHLAQANRELDRTKRERAKLIDEYQHAKGTYDALKAEVAKRHQRADFAAVVSNASYTKSARQLATTTGVLLLHHEELATLDAALGTDEDVPES